VGERACVAAHHRCCTHLSEVENLHFGMQEMEAHLEKRLQEQEEKHAEELRRAKVHSSMMWRFSDLSGRDLTGLDLSGLDLSQADLRNADLSRCVLAGTQLPTELSSCVWAGADLTDCDLRACNLHGGHLANAELSNCLLPVDLRRCDLSGCDLSLRDLSRNLAGAKIATSLPIPTSLTFAGGSVVLNTRFRGASGPTLLPLLLE
jgi:uncharacterized protein YjbI with pentapeptide repeats